MLACLTPNIQLHSQPASVGSVLTSDVFPLRVGLRYEYAYLRSYINFPYHSLWSNQTDSGRVSFVLRDSSIDSFNWITWQADRITSISHGFDQYFPSEVHQKIIQTDTVRFQFVEQNYGAHSIVMPEQVLFSGSPYQPCLSPWSGFSINRLADLDTLVVYDNPYPGSGNYDSLVFIRGKGLYLQWKRRYYGGNNEFFDNHTNYQIGLPVVEVVQHQQVPASIGLAQNYPNPFNPITTIEFSLAASNHATLKVFDILGRDVVTLADDFMISGKHTAVFDASRWPSGTYVYRLSAAGTVITRKLLVTK